jgi:hypothetical protein
VSSPLPLAWLSKVAARSGADTETAVFPPSCAWKFGAIIHHLPGWEHAPSPAGKREFSREGLPSLTLPAGKREFSRKGKPSLTLPAGKREFSRKGKPSLTLPAGKREFAREGKPSLTLPRKQTGFISEGWPTALALPIGIERVFQGGQALPTLT